MGKPTGFLEIERRERPYLPIAKRVRSWREFVQPLAGEEVERQAGRCMNCGVPFCHTGCPLSNLIPDWNELVWRADWRAALDQLHATNNFPEFTGRICPAPCEAACTLNIDEAPVTIKTIECQIIDRGWREGWIVPETAASATGRKIAIVGSGPAGLACAQQLARAGHQVTVFEKSDRLGGLLRYGIPDFQMEKALIERRIEQMRAEGVVFRTSAHVGDAIRLDSLLGDFDAVVLAGGAELPRDLPIPGRELAGVHFAMDFLTQQNKRGAGDPEARAAPKGTITAKGKRVVVIGGGDTGSDCIGTAIRQGAREVVQLEILSAPPLKEVKALTWPNWPLKMRTSSSQEEGCERDFAVGTRAARGADGSIEALECARLDWASGTMGEVEGSAFEIPCELVLLAMGFLGPRRDGLLDGAGVELDARGNVATAPGRYQTSHPRIFACGDMRRGQS
ncbi:MAG: glutamate synthase subunit beta, partial [Caulobacteraceae bacterium]